MTEKRRKVTKKLGRPPKHGGYSYLTKGILPENRRHVRKYLSEVRECLVADLGPEEKDLSTAQRILIDRITCKLGVLRCVEEFLKERSIMQGDELAPSLKNHYLAYSNSIRLDLVALGIKPENSRAVLTPFELAAKVDRENEEKLKKAASVKPL